MGLYIDSLTPEFKAYCLDKLNILLTKHNVKLDSPVKFNLEDTHGNHNRSNNYFFQFKAISERYTIDPMSFLNLGMSGWPSNCGVCIWHQMGLGSGYFPILSKELKLEIIELYKKYVKQMNYSQIHYSAVIGAQDELIDLLVSSGFEVVKEMSFKNRRSGNKLCYLICNI